ncbi:MAG: hypothetical protein EBU90_31705 [Proteobacteria bacterium]|nr:hypothetical protein [Pseudomonadota bacterium]
MALTRGRLTNGIVNVSAGTTVGIVTVASSKKVYIKSIVAHNAISTSTISAQVYYVPNGGSVSANNRLFNVSIAQSETVFIEPSYPIVLTTTGDTLSIGCSVGQLNVLVSGDHC